MPTAINHSWDYSAPLADVQAMLMDSAFREKVCRAQHAETSTVVIDRTTVQVTSTQSTASAPAIARKFVGDSITIAITERWDGPKAELQIDVPGQPGGAVGTIELIENDGVTTQRFNLEITAKVPFIGSKVEAMIGEFLVKASMKEAATGRSWLRGRAGSESQ